MRQRLMVSDPPTRPDAIPKGMPLDHLVPVTRGRTGFDQAVTPPLGWTIDHQRAERGLGRRKQVPDV